MLKKEDLRSRSFWTELAYKVSDLAILTALAYALYQVFQDRSAYLHKVFRDGLNCDTCLESTVFYHDSSLFAVLALIVILTLSTRKFLLYIPLRILVAIGLVAYVGDVATMKEFFTRLKISDVKIYGDKLDLIWRHVQNTGMLEQQALPIYVMAALAILVIVFPPRRRIGIKWFAFLMIVPIACYIAGQTIPRNSYVHEWAVTNVYEANMGQGVAIKYSEQYTKELFQEAKAPGQCHPGLDQQKDVMLLVLESWSPVQSQLLSGVNNWTPKLDKLAQDNSYYSNFYAGGFTTNEGLMSILGGLEFLSPIKSYFAVYMFESAWDLEATVPKAFKSAGYDTTFMTTGNLGFTRKGDWLKNLGFDNIDGHDNAIYEGIPRLHFDSAPDAVLYEHALQTLDAADRSKPQFITVENVSTHHPYIHPTTKAREAEAVFRYMDDTVLDFYQKLEARKFFDNGMLIIVSDHRAMVPIMPPERKRLGEKAPSLVPLIVVGGPGPKGEIDSLFHHTDILPSVENYVAQESCRTEKRRSIFTPEQNEERCFFHAKGSDRNEIDVICPDGFGVVRLKGDDTTFKRSEGIDKAQRKVLLDEINRYRIEGDTRHKEWWQRRK